MGRRFPFGGGPGPRVFERGDLKYALLDLLKERPKHGYEMMKELEDRAGGFYAPSAGAIYPTLQLLEDRGWVTSEAVEGKKVYQITPEGTKALAEAAARREERGGPFGGPGRHEHHGHGPGSREDEAWGPGFGPWGPGRGPWGPGRGPWGDPNGRRGQTEARELARQARDLARTMMVAGMHSLGDPQRLTQLRQIIERTRAEVEAFIRSEDGPSAGSSSDGPSGEGGSGPIEQL
jgi:DNA-binding PadR family transcriptional regulator